MSKKQTAKTSSPKALGASAPKSRAAGKRSSRSSSRSAKAAPSKDERGAADGTKVSAPPQPSQPLQAVPPFSKSIAGKKEYDAKLLEFTSFYEKKIYDLEQMLDISRSFSSELELSKLLESIKYICMAQLHVLRVNIFVRGDLDEDDVYKLEASRDDIDIDKSVNYEFSVRDPVAVFLFNERAPATFERIKQGVPKGTDLSMLSSLSPTLVVPLIEKNNMNGILLLGERIVFDNQEEYSEYERSQIMSIATLAAVAINNASLVERSSTDMMTKLKLKYYFFNSLSSRLDNAAERKLPLAVLMFDIDHFKIFNDTHGHECGDYVLITVASIIKQSLRGGDLASRYGGEEFTALLDNTDREEAVRVADRIRANVEKYEFVFRKKKLHVTISGGIAVFNVKSNPVVSPKALVDQADQGLYMSKHNGRNLVTYADPALLKG